jgi:hypothetical protein
MTFESLRDALRSKPFRRFRIRLADGERVLVTHPELCFTPPRPGRTFVVATPDGGFLLIDLTMVTALEFGTNGRKRQAG